MNPLYVLAANFQGQSGTLTFRNSAQELQINLAAVVVSGGGGGSGPGSGVQVSQYNFLSPLSQWVVNHNRNRNVVIQVFTVGGLEILAEIQNLNLNQAIVNFDSPQSGYALIT